LFPSKTQSGLYARSHVGSHNDNGSFDGPPMAVHIEHLRCARCLKWTDARTGTSYRVKCFVVDEYTEIMNKVVPEDRPGPGVALTSSL
jgi:hypothetical protein